MLPLVAAACLCLLVLQPAAGSGPSSSIAGLKSDDADLAAKSRAAVLELYSLDARLAAAQRRLSRLQTAEQQLAFQRASLAHELRIARVDARLSQNRLAVRLRFLYEHGGTSSLDVLMGATSLEDALTQLDDFDRVAAANASVLLQVQSSSRHLEALRLAIGARVRALAETTTAAAHTVTELQQLRAGRVAYISELATKRSLDAARIARITAEAQAATIRSEALAAAPATQSAGPVLTAATVTPAAPAVPGARTLTVVATGYDLPGHTSTGLPVGWGIAAVDPSVIPLGTHLVVPGYGVAVAADTGGSITGTTIDLWFPTAAQAYAWGRRTVTISLNQG
jgi:cystine transport system substrate-binding protein